MHWPQDYIRYTFWWETLTVNITVFVDKKTPQGIFNSISQQSLVYMEVKAAL